jgi:glycosyltransferase involved in cell wall biosynthesis
MAIVTPSFNQAGFLERTIRSVLDQEYPRLEYVVQDGGSWDQTGGILDRYRDRLAHVESRKDRGQAHAINLGFRHTTGEIMAYLNSDDALLPGTLAYVARYFALHPAVDVVYGHRIVIDEHDQEVGRWLLPPHEDHAIIWADYVPQETLFWRRRIWEKVGAAMDESYQFALDWDLLLRFRDAGARFKRLPRFLGAFRVHHQQKTSVTIAGVGARETDRLMLRLHGRTVTHEERLRRVRIFLGKHVVLHKLYRLGLLSA